MQNIQIINQDQIHIVEQAALKQASLMPGPRMSAQFDIVEEKTVKLLKNTLRQSVTDLVMETHRDYVMKQFQWKVEKQLKKAQKAGLTVFYNPGQQQTFTECNGWNNIHIIQHSFLLREDQMFEFITADGMWGDGVVGELGQYMRDRIMKKIDNIWSKAGY